MNGWLIYDRAGSARNAWFIQALIDEARETDFSLQLIEAEDLLFGTNGHCFLRYQDREVSPPDFALVRTVFPFLSEHLEKMGVKLFNSATVSEICNDKRKTHLLFSDLGVQMAESFFCDRKSTDFSQFNYPLVLKSTSGHGGNEVFFVNSSQEALAKAELFSENSLLLQQPVTPGVDVRVYLLDGEPIATVRRTSHEDFRSNFSLGGNVQLTQPSVEMLQIVEMVCKLLDPWFVGVDFTFDANGAPILNEIEDIVGTRMLYKLTDLEIHRRMICSIKEHL